MFVKGPLLIPVTLEYIIKSNIWNIRLYCFCEATYLFQEGLTWRESLSVNRCRSIWRRVVNGAWDWKNHRGAAWKKMSIIYVCVLTYWPCKNYRTRNATIWKLFPHYWSFKRVIHRRLVVYSHKKAVIRSFGVSLLLAWAGCWTNSRVFLSDLRHNGHVKSL